MDKLKFADKERDVASATEKIQSQLNESHKRQTELFNEISILKVRFYIFIRLCNVPIKFFRLLEDCLYLFTATII